MGSPSRFSHNWTVRTSRPKRDATSFHESNRSPDLGIDSPFPLKDAKGLCMAITSLLRWKDSRAEHDHAEWLALGCIETFTVVKNDKFLHM
jgi:hypothetical protein